MEKLNDVAVLRNILGDGSRDNDPGILDRKIPKFNIQPQKDRLNMFLKSSPPKNRMNIMLDYHSKNAENYNPKEYMNELHSMIPNNPKFGKTEIYTDTLKVESPINMSTTKNSEYNDSFKESNPEINYPASSGYTDINTLNAAINAEHAGSNIGKGVNYINDLWNGTTGKSWIKTAPAKEKAQNIWSNVQLGANAIKTGFYGQQPIETPEDRAKRERATSVKRAQYAYGARQFFKGPFNQTKVNAITDNLGYNISSGNLLSLGNRGATQKYTIARNLFIGYMKQLIAKKKKPGVNSFETLIPHLGPNESKKLIGYKNAMEKAQAEMQGSQFLSGEGAKTVIQTSTVRPNIKSHTQIGNKNPGYSDLSFGNPETLGRLGVSQGLEANSISNKWNALTSGGSFYRGQDKILGFIGKSKDMSGSSAADKIKRYL